MRLGDRQEDPAGEVRGMRTVGNYIRAPGGWRRMRWDEHLHVNLERDYRDMFSRPHPFAALFETKRVTLAAENGRRIYSAGYQAGQRLAHVPAAVEENDRDAEKFAARYGDAGVVEYTDGFRDGWAGRPPRCQLRLADLPWR